jgi:thioredoxin-dependent peroxiredoxin
MTTVITALRTGEAAPPFSLFNQQERNVALSDLRGRWVVLYFYPKDDTPGCTTEACEFTDQLKSFETLEARVFGVSPDSPESHQKFIAKHHLKIELLSDPDHEVLEHYGAWGEKNVFGKKSRGVLRSTVIIDPQGKIAFHWPAVSPAGHAQEVREKLQSLRQPQ